MRTSASALCWDEVSLPRSISAAELDALILRELAQNWRKVARVVGYAKQSCDARSLPVSMDVIAARVRMLVEAGTIEGVGNLSMWRRSEMRLRPRADQNRTSKKDAFCWIRTMRQVFKCQAARPKNTYARHKAGHNKIPRHTRVAGARQQFIASGSTSGR
jgi:hypothetical protein